MARRKSRRRNKPFDPRSAHGSVLPSGYVVDVLDDPYDGLAHAEATLVRPRHARNGSGTVREWQAPQRPQLVVARRREDVLGALHARRQIGALPRTRPAANTR
jgi:hypothetical protein